MTPVHDSQLIEQMESIPAVASMMTAVEQTRCFWKARNYWARDISTDLKIAKLEEVERAVALDGHCETSSGERYDFENVDGYLVYDRSMI